MRRFAAARMPLTRRLRRHPLVRTSDRVEALALLVAVALSVIGLGIGSAVGAAVHTERARAFAQEAHTRHMVVATTITDNALSRRRTPGATVEVRWRVNGADHMGTFSRDRSANHDGTVGVWVNQYGNQVGSPTPPWRAVVDAVGAGAALWLAVTIAVAALLALLRWWLNRLRYAGWDRDITSLAGDGGGRTNHHNA